MPHLLACAALLVSGACTSTPPDLNTCGTADLRIEFAAKGKADGRGAHVPLRFTNTGAAPCSLRGAPTVVYLHHPGGEPVGLPARRDPDGPDVTLGVGETASAGLLLSTAPLRTPGCPRVRVGGVGVTPPGAGDRVFLARDAITCGPPFDGPYLEVGPVGSGPGGAEPPRS
ncbi:DUF4232 domain-containing protein [Actinosynnema sp. NPDC059797]